MKNKENKEKSDKEQEDTATNEIKENLIEGAHKPFVAYEKKLERLQKEFDMTTEMIEKNFSNFSAWHYRSKLLIKIHESSGSLYQVPIPVIESELEKIKHALFTEPNDQSSWNYHRWLMSLLIPIHIVDLSYDKESNEIKLQISAVIRKSEGIDMQINGKN